MASIFKVKGQDRWTITYTDETRRRRKKMGYKDRETTQVLADKLEDRVKKIRDGIESPEVATEEGDGVVARLLLAWQREAYASGVDGKSIVDEIAQVKLLLHVASGNDVPSNYEWRRKMHVAPIQESVSQFKSPSITYERLTRAIRRLEASGMSAKRAAMCSAAMCRFLEWAYRKAPLPVHEIAMFVFLERNRLRGRSKLRKPRLNNRLARTCSAIADAINEIQQ